MYKPCTFAERLKELLNVTDTTSAELSRISGISKSSISHYLKGDWEAKQDKIFAIANATNVSEAWLMGYDVPMNKEPVSNEEDGQLKELCNIFSSLSEEHQAQAVDYLRFLSAQEQKK